MTRPIQTLLLVEDFPPDRELYRRCLMADSECAYCLLEADSVMAGLALCRERTIDAILLDYLLPDGNGIEFLQALHAQSNGESPPVVMITGEGDERIAVEALKLGAEDYLVKRHLTPKLLQLTMRSAIENARLRLQLRQSHDRFRVSIENMLDCFGIYAAIRDEFGRIIDFRFDYLNAAALESNGMTSADMSKTLCEVFPAHQECGLFEDYCLVVETGESLVKENLTYSDIFGMQHLTRAYDIRASKLGDGLVISWRDTTDRKRLELELNQKIADLEQQQHRLQRLIDTAPIGIGIGTAEGEVKVINDEMLRLHDYTREEFEQQGMNWRDFTPPESSEQTEQAMERLWQEGNIPSEEKELIWRNGSRLPIWISAMRWLDGTDEHIAFAVDLTRQKQVETALQASQQRYQQLAGAMPQMVWTADATGAVNYWNQQWYDYSGLSEAESMGLACTSTIHPDDRDRTLEQWGQSVLTGVPFEIEYRVCRWDGVYHWFISRGMPTRDDHGQVIGWIGTITNIDELKRSQADLRDREAQLQIGVQVAGVALARFDYKTNTVELSPEAAALYGIPSNELLITRNRIHATFHPDDRAELAQLIQQVIDPAGSGWFAREHRVVWQNGEVRWLSVRKQVFFDRSGDIPRPDHAILAAIDITEQKQAEQNRLLLAQIVASSNDAIIGFTPEQTIISWNAGAEQIFGYTCAEVLGQSIAILAPVDRRHEPQSICERLQRGETIEQYETQRQRKDGSLVDVAVTISPIRTEKNEIIGVSATMRDITAQKQLEQERERLLREAQAAREEAEAANRSKDEFVAVVAHELRSPLNSISGWAKLLQARKLDEATMARALDAIWRNTQVQVQLVEDLLDISRIVRGALQITFAPVDWITVIEAALEIVRPMADEKQIQIETHLMPTPQISGESNRLQQIAVNLLTNAIKFTPEGGRVEVHLEQADTQVVLWVRDTGKGIAPEFLPHIFDRYKQGQENTGSKDGLGLGLAIVKNLVELHSGTITADSAGIGAGATFTICLPGLETLTPRPDSFVVDATSLAGIRILAIDDDPDMLNLIAFVLQDFGADVKAVTTARAALECLSQFRPDILLSDIAMPEGDGYELVQQVKLSPEGQIPAIALTAYASASDRERSRLAGFQQHLVKPVDPENLVAAILSLVRGETP
ncbi:PAS domain S-box protein [Leptolyngbya sp. AN03gr2]|uniref:PAS domain S-box protein n=1 Tax=unclassified Leptolyngbya TaxID=2650499 RepID=UPI003D31AC2F